ncbi:glycosyltransferase family 2 protein [Clostridium celatum]|uniref:glycosyltransferase family 2 protein n=1 Tax=Clostridium celatum TaxID=36834 RepID=UPI00189992E2|nr:glycosyltransferase family 2 protein [Clostridium celatum]
MFSFVIVNWNGSDLIKQCLDSLTKSSYKDFKVYIVDNGSKDNSLESIKTFEEKLDIITIPLEKNYGFALANNKGIEKAINDDSEYIITLNNDIEIQEDTLDKLIKFIDENKDTDIFQLLMINYFERNLIDSIGMSFNERLFVTQLGYRDPLKNLEKYDINIEGACAGAAVYSKKSLRKICINNNEYFKNDFFAYYEDVDLALRLNNNGFKTKLAKDSIVYHMHSATGNKNSTFKDYYLTRNLFKYLKANQSENIYKKNKRFYYKNTLGRIVRHLKNGNIDGAKAIIKGFNDYRLNK